MILRFLIISTQFDILTHRHKLRTTQFQALFSISVIFVSQDFEQSKKKSQKRDESKGTVDFSFEYI